MGRDSDTESLMSKRRKREREQQNEERAVATFGSKVPGLNQAIEDIQTIEIYAHDQVQNVNCQLRKLKETGNS